MKTLILLLCILNGANFYPMKDRQVNIFEYFSRNDTSPPNIDINHLLKNLEHLNPVSRSNDVEITRERDPLDVISRQRRSSSSHSTEKGNCKYVDFYIDVGENFIPPKLNIGACVGGPLVMKDMGESQYFNLMKAKVLKSDKNSAAKYPLLQFKEEKEINLIVNDSLSYDIVPSCKVTFKSVQLLYRVKNSEDQQMYMQSPIISDLVVDSCN